MWVVSRSGTGCLEQNRENEHYKIFKSTILKSVRVNYLLALYFYSIHLLSVASIIMDHYLSTHVSQRPDAIAVEDDTQKLTYKGLDREVDRLASVLKNYHLGPEEPVCIIEGINCNLIIAQLAIIRARLTCVPIEPSTPKLLSLIHI